MKTQRQANIELARILGCLLVICIHFIVYTQQDQIFQNEFLIRCFVTDGVPIFWYIMGFFLFRGSITKKAIKTITDLLIPAFIVMLFAQIWQDWIRADFGVVNFFSCLDMHSFDAQNLFGNILKWNAKMTFGGHFWYIFSYVQVILWAPLLRYVCVDEPKAGKCRHYLMILAALSVINTDIKNIYVLTINGEAYSPTIYTVITPVLLFVLLGYEISIHYNKIQKNAKWIRWVGFLGFFLFNFIKYKLSFYYINIDINNTYFMGTNTVMGYLASLCLFLFLICIKIPDNSKTAKLINVIASYTLGIYLIHVCTIGKLKAIGVKDIVYTLANNYPDSFFAELLCTIMYAIVVFITSGCIIFLIRLIKKSAIYIYKKVARIK